MSSTVERNYRAVIAATPKFKAAAEVAGEIGQRAGVSRDTAWRWLQEAVVNGHVVREQEPGYREVNRYHRQGAPNPYPDELLEGGES